MLFGIYSIKVSTFLDVCIIFFLLFVFVFVSVKRYLFHAQSVIMDIKVAFVVLSYLSVESLSSVAMMLKIMFDVFVEFCKNYEHNRCLLIG